MGTLPVDIGRVRHGYRPGDVGGVRGSQVGSGQVAPVPTRPVVWYAPTDQGGHPAYVAAILAAADRPVVWLAGRHLPPQELPAAVTVDQALPSLWTDASQTALIGPWRRFSRIVLRDLRAVVLIARRHRGSILHLQESVTPVWAVALGWLRRRRGVHSVVTVHTVRAHQPGMRGRILTSGAVQAAAHADVVVVHGTDTLDRLRAHRAARRAAVRVVPHFAWEPQGTEGAEATTSAADGDGPGRRGRGQPLRLLFFGHVRANKGLHVLLEALTSVPDVRLVVAGAASPATQAQLHAEVARHGIGERVDLRFGFVPDDELAATFAAVDAVVLPYQTFEAQSGVLHLAMGYGVPQLVTDVGELGATVRRYGSGVVCAPGVAGLVAGLEALQAADLAALHGASRAAARQLHPAGHWEALCELYDALDEGFAQRQAW